MEHNQRASLNQATSGRDHATKLATRSSRWSQRSSAWRTSEERGVSHLTQHLNRTLGPHYSCTGTRGLGMPAGSFRPPASQEPPQKLQRGAVPDLPCTSSAGSGLRQLVRWRNGCPGRALWPYGTRSGEASTAPPLPNSPGHRLSRGRPDRPSARGWKRASDTSCSSPWISSPAHLQPESKTVRAPA